MKCPSCKRDLAIIGIIGDIHYCPLCGKELNIEDGSGGKTETATAGPPENAMKSKPKPKRRKYGKRPA